MGRVERGIQAAIGAATLSSHRTHRVGAALFLGSRLVSLGFNNHRTNPKQRGFLFREHAETNCLIGTRRWTLDRAILYVARINSFGPQMARPCPACQTLLKAVGIRRVWYTNVKGKPEKLILLP